VPIYEYYCQDCRRRVSMLVRSISNPGTPVCPRCGGRHLERLMSRFTRVRSEEDRLDALADPARSAIWTRMTRRAWRAGPRRWARSWAKTWARILMR